MWAEGPVGEEPATHAYSPGLYPAALGKPLGTQTSECFKQTLWLRRADRCEGGLLPCQVRHRKGAN